MHYHSVINNSLVCGLTGVSLPSEQYYTKVTTGIDNNMTGICFSVTNGTNFFFNLKHMLHNSVPFKKNYSRGVKCKTDLLFLERRDCIVLTN